MISYSSHSQILASFHAEDTNVIRDQPSREVCLFVIVGNATNECSCDILNFSPALFGIGMHEVGADDARSWGKIESAGS